MRQKSGTFQEFKDHTLAIVRGERRVEPGEPEIWSETRRPREGGGSGGGDETLAPGFPPTRE